MLVRQALQFKLFLVKNSQDSCPLEFLSFSKRPRDVILFRGMAEYLG